MLLVSLLAVAAGVVGFLRGPLHLPDKLLAVLDQRASVVSMVVGILGLLMTGLGLWLHARAPAADAETPPGPASSGPASPVMGGGMSGGMVAGQISGPVRAHGPGATVAEGGRSIAMGGASSGPVMSGDRAIVVSGGFVGHIGDLHQMPPPKPDGGLVRVEQAKPRLFVGGQDPLRLRGDPGPAPGLVAVGVPVAIAENSTDIGLTCVYSGSADRC
ncbi:hypothetical protein [Nonomuraea sediminis]|uniref:hypothetical protein n=1 Tax=Nonomuraea sediminis TaxID=2835864 RepID=UPI001BDC8243|nr:hypothetical protein [Nonomuraea sediminis]